MHVDTLEPFGMVHTLVRYAHDASELSHRWVADEDPHRGASAMPLPPNQVSGARRRPRSDPFHRSCETTHQSFLDRRAILALRRYNEAWFGDSVLGIGQTEESGIGTIRARSWASMTNCNIVDNSHLAVLSLD